MKLERFLRKERFVYAVLDPSGSRVIGSLYIFPLGCNPYRSRVYYWITAGDREALEQAFYLETRKWLNANWPFRLNYYPGPNLNDWQRGHLYDKSWATGSIGFARCLFWHGTPPYAR